MHFRCCPSLPRVGAICLVAALNARLCLIASEYCWECLSTLLMFETTRSQLYWPSHAIGGFIHPHRGYASNQSVWESIDQMEIRQETQSNMYTIRLDSNQVSLSSSRSIRLATCHLGAGCAGIYDLYHAIMDEGLGLYWVVDYLTVLISCTTARFLVNA